VHYVIKRSLADMASSFGRKAMLSRSVCLIAVGGTIDKLYPPDRGSYQFVFSDVPAAAYIMRRARVSAPLIVRNTPPKDSLDMDEQDRIRLARMCADTGTEGVILTHGTDTMIETARLISREGMQKTIVLTGAAQPEQIRDSDADFNVGFAWCAVQVLPHGVYIAMNGNVFPWDACVKGEDGIFVGVP
jgi:L-asparaginase